MISLRWELTASSNIYIGGKNMQKEKIRRILLGLGIPAHFAGYEYLQTAVMECVNDPELKHKVTTALYPKVAKVHNTTSHRVERCIRTALGKVEWDQPQIRKDFGGAKCTNGHVIARLSELVGMEEKPE